MGAVQAAQHPCMPSPCSRNPKSPQILPLGWRITPPEPDSLKQCFRLEINFWSPIQASVGPGPVPGPQHLFPESTRGLVLHPKSAAQRRFFGTKDGS